MFEQNREKIGHLPLVFKMSTMVQTALSVRVHKIFEKLKFFAPKSVDTRM